VNCILDADVANVFFSLADNPETHAHSINLTEHHCTKDVTK